MLPTISAGTTLSVSQSLPVVKTQSGFEALTFTQIRGVRSIGDFGKQHQTVDHSDIDSDFVYKKRVGYSNGSLELELYKLIDDGQVILKNAIDLDLSYSFKINETDGSIYYFTGMASRRLLGIGDSSAVANNKITIEIDSQIIEI